MELLSRVRAWIGAVLGVLPALVAGAAPEPAAMSWVVRHYSSTSGLPVSSAADAMVDAEGFLWLATHDGLARFDGREFSVYDVARFPEMGSNRILGLYAARPDRLYAVGVNGELLRIASSGIRRVVPAGERSTTRVRFAQSAPLCFTLSAGLYCEVDGHLRQRRAWAEADAVRLAVPHGAADWVLRGDGVLQYCHASACRVVDTGKPLQFRSDELAHAERQGDALVLALPKVGLLWAKPDQPARWLMQDGADGRDLLQLRSEPDGSVMVATSDGLYRVDALGLRPVWPEAPIHGLSQVRSWRGPDGALWHAEEARLYRERQLALTTRGMVTGLRFGEGGMVFVTTLRDGMYVISPPRVRLLEGDALLEAGNLYGLSLADDGSAWFGTLGSGLLRRRPDGRVQRYDRDQGLPGDNIWAVWAAGDSVLAASYMPGLWEWQPQTDQFRVAQVPAGLAAARTLAFARHPDGSLWVGGSEGAWARTREAGWVRRWPLDGSAVSVRALAFAADGTVWLGCDDGLWRWQDAAAHPVAHGLLDGVEVRGLTLAQDGSLWVSTGGRGLLRIAADDPRGLRALRLGRAQGLPSNSPHAVIADPARPGDVWVNSNQGIYRISREGLAGLLRGESSVMSPLTLGLADGLTELEGNGGVQPAAAVDPDGRLWFPSQRGVVQVDPQALPLRRQPPWAVIDGLHHEGQALLAEAPLPVGLRAVQVHYNAADLYSGRAVRFRHRLLPGEQHWTEAGERRVAAYAALPPGTHRFEVLAGNGDGFWASRPAVLEFHVSPYLYETRWFQAVASASGVLALLVLAQWRLRRARRLARVLDLQVQRRTLELRNEKLRVESTLDDLAEAHRRLALTHEEIADRNRKLAEQTGRLESLDRFRTRLLADVSHELRTPLMLIRMPLQDLVEAPAGLPEAQRARLQLPLQQTARLSHLVEQLVELVQAEAGKLPLKVRRLDLVRHLRQVMDGFQPMATQAQLRLELQVAADLPPLYADPDHLTTLFGNLLDNALKYGPPGSVVRVCVSAWAEPVWARIEVIDQGPGFPAEQAAALFQRFHRAEGPPRQGREGLGIGLALARELVELHGGRIGAALDPARGTLFWIELPGGSAHIELTDLALDVAQAPLIDAPAGSSGGILLVEDHPELAAYLGERLGEWHAVQVESSAEAAWRALQQARYDVLICDVVLPGMDGISLCRQIRQDGRWRELPIVLMSAKSTAADRDTALAAGAQCWLGKPFSFADLLNTLLPLWLPESARQPESVPAPLSVPLPDAAATPSLFTSNTTADPLLQVALLHLANPKFGVAQWAELAHLSERQLRRRVVELTQLAPLSWLREQRLLKVRGLLSSGSCQTLVAAGALAGLDNPSYLYRLYRARFGED